MPGFMEQEKEITTKIKTKDTFRKAVCLHLIKEVYEEIRKEKTHDGL